MTDSHRAPADLRSRLSALPSLTGSAPPFDPEAAPAHPGTVFAEWLITAIDAGVLEPHAMTLSTVSPDGMPDARVLILKDFDPDGRWAFASSAASAKGEQLAASSAAALTFAWPPLIRSVRIRGMVATDDPAASATDFRGRSLNARAVALSGRQSALLNGPASLDADVQAAAGQLEQKPDLAPPDWRKYWLTARTVEFWQGSPSRLHLRLQYVRRQDGWQRRRLRP